MSEEKQTSKPELDMFVNDLNGRARPKFRPNTRLLSRTLYPFPGYMVIRFSIIAAGVAIAANMPVSADPLLQRPVLRIYQPVRIALPDFVAADLSEAEPAHSISQIIASDLKQSGAFAPLNQVILSEKNGSIDEVPQFADWRAINTQELVVGRVTRQPDARIKVEFRLWDVFNGEQLASQQYTGNPDDLNRIGHMVSGDIYERIMGNKRTFD